MITYDTEYLRALVERLRHVDPKAQVVTQLVPMPWLSGSPSFFVFLLCVR